GDVRRGRGRGVGGVVGRIGAANGDAADSYGLGCARVLVGKAGSGVAGAQDIARHPIVRERHRRVGGPVINPVHARGAHSQRARRDVRRGRGRGVGGVVGRIGAADGDAADAHGLGRADVLVVETRRRV